MSAVHLEAYDWGLLEKKSPRMFILGEITDALDVFRHVQQEIVFRGRRVLVLAAPDSLKVAQRVRVFQHSWDFVLRIRANTDYSLLASYLQHSAKPITVLWLGTEVPQVLLTKVDTNVFWVCMSGTLPVARDLFTVFISPTLPPFKYKDWLIAQQPSQISAVLGSLDDFREKKAGLVLVGRSVQWYDSAGLETEAERPGVTEVREVLKWCTDQLSEN